MNSDGRAGMNQIYLQSNMKKRTAIWRTAQVPCLLLCHRMRRKIPREIHSAPMSQKMLRGIA
jgi:hypothetical protein